MDSGILFHYNLFKTKNLSQNIWESNNWKMLIHDNDMRDLQIALKYISKRK